jgi:phage terminase large subunit GpA-like protein
MEQETIILNPFKNGLRPIENITVSEWADKYRFLSSVSAAEPGRFRTNRVPYIREIADNLSKQSDVWKIIVSKGAQLGLTELGNNWIGSIIDINPGPTIMVMPTEDAVKKNSRTRITPMINSCPSLKDKIKEVGAKDAQNTITSKSFNGGVLLMIGANSPVGLSSTPAGNIFLDEVDRYPHSAGGEGNPLDLAEARASTFSNKKIYVISTPTNSGESIIESEFLEGDQRYYNVPCFYCGDKFVLKFAYLTYNENDPESTRMACPSCGGLHEEKHKTNMLLNGEWIATAKPSDPLIRSYHISSLYSPAGWLSWVQVVRKFLKIKKDVNRERTFVNTVLGETFKIKSDAPDHENLYNRREEYEIGTIPDGVYFLTMGVDIQGDRIEGEVVGWGIGRETWSIEYFVFVGDTSKPKVWEMLSNQINKQYEFGEQTMSINLTCIDSGYKTSTVYDFVAKFPYSKVIPIKGSSNNLNVMVSPPRAYNVARSGKKIEARKVWNLGTSLLKSELYGFLKLKAKEAESGLDEYPEGYCHFPQYDRHYFKMLTAEEQQLTVNKKGFEEYQWVLKSGARNEALDVRCYARAAAYIIGIDRFKNDTWDKIKIQSTTDIIKKPEAVKKPVKKSGYW